MEEKDIESAIEGILFAAGEPVKVERLSLALGVPQEECRQALRSLADEYSYNRRGIRMVQMEDSWQMCSAPEQAGVIRRALERRKPPQLSPVALEALAVVAYYQPTTRTYVDQIRGVDSSYTMGLLQERGLIEECGRLDAPGRPILYQTTPLFLRSFGLHSLEELPPLPDGSGEELTDQLELPLEKAEEG
jgi:segregation and condensation protein B